MTVEPFIQMPAQLEPYRFRLRWFLLGMQDWLREQALPEARRSPEGRAEAARRPGLRSLAVCAIVLMLVLLAAGPVASVVAPGMAGTLTAVGPGFVAATSMAAGIAIGALFVVGVPARFAWRGWKFARRMCRRGYEIEMGLRLPVGRYMSQV